MKPRMEQATVAVVLLLASLALLFTSPTAGDFWWSDAPRHALNGAFVKDLVAAFPWRHPAIWAYDYYLKYPALTILFYPPLFYIVEAGVFAVLGVSHFSAQVTVTLFVFILAVGTYSLARFLLPRWSALGTSLLLIGSPATAFWGRQVMLDVPCYAALVGSVFLFVRHLQTARTSDIYLSAICMLAAVYLKINAIFIVPVLAVTLLMAKGRSILNDGAVVRSIIIGVLGLIPAALLTWRFGAANVQSVGGRAIDLPISSIHAWLFYAEAIPSELGYLTVVLGVLGLALIALRRAPPRENWFAAVLLGWFGFGYLFFSAIGIREPRHSLMILFPLVLGAMIALHRILPSHLAQVAALLLGGCTFVFSLLLCPPPVVAGYRAVANYVVTHAPKKGLVLFSGYRDGNFVFEMRTHEERRDISTVRADKLLLRIAVERVRGVQQAGYTQDDIARMLRDFGVALVVYQPGFWEDLREMSDLAAVIHSSDFIRIASFSITGLLSRGNDSDRIEIYRPTYPIERTRQNLRLNLSIIDQNVQGKIGPQAR